MIKTRRENDDQIKETKFYHQIQMTKLAELDTQWDASQWDPVLSGQTQILTQDEDQVVTVASKKRRNVRN